MTFFDIYLGVMILFGLFCCGMLTAMYRMMRDEETKQ